MNLKDDSCGRIILFHGINGCEPETHICKMAPEFRNHGFSVIIPNIGTFSVFSMFFSRRIDCRIVETLLSFIKPTDILLGHSNGATLVYMITQKMHVRGAILINAALDSNKRPDADFVHVYYNSGDLVSIFSAFMPFSAWGAMGALGYTGPEDGSTLNIDCGAPPVDWLPPLHGHSALFDSGNTAPWVKFQVAMLLAEFHQTETRILQ